MSYFEQCRVRFTNIKGEDMPDEQYFKIPGISNSRLKLIDPKHEGSPAQYKKGFDHGFNISLILGSAIHSQYLQQDSFILSDYEGKPSGKLGMFIDEVYKYRCRGKKLSEAINLASDSADYWKGKLTKARLKTALKEGFDYYQRLSHGEFRPVEGKEVIVLPKAQLEACKECITALYKNQTVKQFLSENLLEQKQFLNEIALFADLDVTLKDGEHIILPFKGKLDQVIIDPEKKIIYLNDLKTTSKACEMFMGGIYDGEYYPGSFVKLSYYRQFSCYLMLLQMYCEQVLHLTDYNYQCNVIVVETTGLHRTKVYPINNSFIRYGAEEFKELICRVAWAEIHNNWVDPMPINE